MQSTFKSKYILALSFIGILSFLAYLNLTFLTQSQENDGETINKSGKQRMLSQKIALNTIKGNILELENAVEVMSKSHKDLISMEMTETFKDIYFSKPNELDTLVNKYLLNANIFKNTKDKKSKEYILNNSQELLTKLDFATSTYQEESDLRIDNLKRNELYILILTLLTLIVEGIFIFRPADISIVKKTQELQMQSEYLDLITQINTNAIIAVDSKFKILTFNKSAEEMFGYSAIEMINTQLLDDRIIPLKYLKRHNSGLKDFIKSGKLKNENVVFELEGKRKDKSTFPIRISFGVKVEHDIKIVVANIQNISDEKEKDDFIIQQSRFAAMGEMIGNIAHQWRQPLSSISAIATGAKLRYKNNMISDEELNETFIKIKNHTLYLSKTIDDFRNFLNDDKSKEKFNIVDIVNNSLSLIDATYNANNIELHIKNNEKVINVNGSGSQLSQVILNILNNAKDILVDKKIEKKIVLIEIEQSNEKACIKIYDNAGGISEDVIGKIYEPYFTTKHKSEGTGIGLFMSKRIVEQHFEGSLTNKNIDFVVDDKKYFGACFTVSIELV